MKKAKFEYTPPEYYGFVLIMRGKYKNRIGYYDDEDDEDENKGIVYIEGIMGMPNAKYIVIPHKWMMGL